MDEVALMNRTDTKFIIPESEIPELLYELVDNYRALEVAGKKMSDYNSRYFDSTNRDYYHEHHRGKAGRTKVRIRTYVDSHISFLEVKVKDKKGNTDKQRRAIDGFVDHFEGVHQDFLMSLGIDAGSLNSTLENAFSRITLVNNTAVERATIDTSLSFDGRPAVSGSKGGLAIIEIKQPGLNRTSPLFMALKKKGIRPYSISKYCIGMALLYPELKQNLFKPKLLRVKKILN